MGNMPGIQKSNIMPIGNKIPKEVNFVFVQNLLNSDYNSYKL